MHIPPFYKQKPIFALDIGQATVKVVQLGRRRQGVSVVGYGYAEFDPSSIKAGEIIRPEALIMALKPLLKQIVIGRLTTNRIAASIPSAHIFSRILELSGPAAADIPAAVELEAQQYIPLPLEQIYLDHMVLGSKPKGSVRVLLSAAPRKIIDSYLGLFATLQLEVHTLEPSLIAIMRAVNHAHTNNAPKIIIDFGSESSDLAIYDDSLQLSSTAAAGGNHITECIKTTLGLDEQKALAIKTRFGISKSKWQEQLAPALSPILTTLATEVQKLLRYHHERNDTDAEIQSIVIVGGGANLPGLDKFLTQLTGINVSTCNPWDKINIKPLQPPHRLETTLYTTAVGLALQELDR